MLRTKVSELFENKFIAAQPQSTWRRILRAATILLIPVLTAVMCGCGPLSAFALLNSKYVNRLSAERYPWVSWGRPPVKAVKILGTYQHNLCVEAKDRTRYVKQDCTAPSPDCWRKIELWRRVIPLEKTLEDANFSIPDPPGKVVDSVKLRRMTNQTNYAVLEDGSVWIWDYSLYPQDGGGIDAVAAGLLFCGGAAGFIIGISISFVLAVRIWGWRQALLYYAIVAGIYGVVKGVEFVIDTVVGQ